MSSTWHMAWELGWRSSVILVCSLIAAGCCGRRLLVRQFILQLSVLGLLLLPFTTALPKVTWNVLPRLQTEAFQEASTVSGDTAARETPRVPLDAAKMPESIGIAQVPSRAGSEQFANFPQHKVTRRAPSTSPDSLASAASQPQVVRPRFTGGISLLSVSPLAALYAAGVLVMICRLLLGYAQICALRKDSAVCHDENWQAELQRCRARMGVPQAVDLRASANLTTPLTYGCWRPVLLVPVTLLAAATPAERQAILLHELTHIQRQDFAWRLAVHAAQALYWLHPLAWWWGRVFSETQEEVCDAICAAEFGTQSYSEMLVNVVRSVRRSPALTLGLAMSRTSRLSQRLSRIQRQGGLAMSRLSRFTVCILLTLAIPLGVAALLVQPARAQQVDTTDKSLSNPRTPPNTPEAVKKTLEAQPSRPAAKATAAAAVEPHVLLKLVTAKEAPLASKTIKVRRFLSSERFSDLDPQTIEATSDAAGVVSVALPGLAEDVQEVGLEIRLAEHAPFVDGFKVLRTSTVAKPEKAILLPGLHLTTRVFDAEGRPVSDGHVTVLADASEKTYEYSRAYFRCEADGKLEMDVPRDATFGFTVVSERGAPYRVVYPAGTQKIGDIYLQRGCVVAGQLLDRDGKPVPKCVVTLEGEDSQAVDTELEVKRHLGGGQMGLAFYRRTDDQGRFKFPPMTGDVRLYLECNDPAKLPGLLVPVYLSLPASSEKWVPLMLAPTGTISGTIRWSDGKPASNVRLELEVEPNKSESYISLSSARTDAEGKYSLVAPFPLEEAWISPSGLSGKNGKYFMPRPVGAPATGREARWKHVVQYLGEPLTVDWVMTPEQSEEEPEANATTEVKSPDSRDPLAQLEHDIQAAYQAVRAAKTNEEKERAYPRQALMERCLALEAQHRGTRVAIGALHFIMLSAAATLEKETSEARTRALQIIDQHYLKHADVDLLVGSLDAGNGSTEAEPLLNHLVEQSPFAYVRATALSELVELKLNFLRYGESILAFAPRPVAEEEALIKLQTTEDAREYLKRSFAEQRRMRELLAKTDLGELRRSIVETLDRIISQYSGVVTPRRRWRNAATEPEFHADVELHLIDWTELDTWRIRTIAELAAIERYQFTRLQVGMVVPEFEGQDLRLQPIRLSQYRGKVVLLTATLGNLENELYAECARLLKKFGDQPFACVSIIPGAGDGGYSIRAIVEDGKVTWPIIRDNHEDDISHNLCQHTFPVVYLIDQQGIIRHFDDGDHIGTSLESKIEKLLKVDEARKN